MKLLLDELVHLSLALLVGLVCFLEFGNSWLFLVAIAFGFLIDVDHLFDYFACFGLGKFSLKKFFNIGSHMKPFEKVYVILHGWEYVLLFWLAGSWIGAPGLNWAMGLSYLVHLIWDQFSFSHHPLLYFFTFRLLKRFDRKALL